MPSQLPNTFEANTKPNSNLYFKKLTWMIVVIGLIISSGTAIYIKSSIDIRIEEGFVNQCDEIGVKISERLDDHNRILLSGKALFNASETVSREEWYVFTHQQNLEKQLPGIQGIGFSLLIPRQGLPQHIQKIRQEGFPDYKIYPEGDRENYSSIIYLEPFSDRNLRAFGYDMFSEPVRRKAMEQARDTNIAALSGKITLVQETDKQVQAGNLMYVPVYRKGMPITTIEERRNAIDGWVYSPYRMNDLMEGVLGKNYFKEKKQLYIQVFDGLDPLPQNLLYTSVDKKSLSNIEFKRQAQINFNGHYWTLIFEQPVGQIVHEQYLAAWLALVCGTLITLLLFILIRVLLKAREKALILVDKRTKELYVSEKNFKKMVEILPVAICSSVGIEQVFDYLNPTFVNLFGYSIEEVPTLEYWWPLAYPDKIYRQQISEEWAKRIQHAIETQSSIEAMAAEVTCKNGSKRNILWGYITGEEKNYTFGIDLTDRITAEKELSRTKEHYKLLTEISPSGIWMTDALGNNTYASPRWSEITSITASKAKGTGWSEKIHPDDKEKIFNEWKKSAITNTMYQSEFRFVNSNGKIIWVLCIASVLKDHGEITGWIGTITDITARKKAEKEKQDLEKQLVRMEKMEALGLLAGGVAHDLNNVLSGIVSYPELLMMGLPNDHRFRKPLELIHSSGLQASAIVNDLLTLARRGVMATEIVNLNNIIMDYLKSPEHYKLLSYNNVVIETNLNKSLANIKGSEIHLRTTIMNLVLNAVEAQTSRGKIIISTENQHIDKPIPGYESIKKGEFAVVTIEDKGIGINAKDLQRIFEPFYTKKIMGRSGTGLGMSVVWGTVQDHYGYINVESIENKGTKFYLYFPIVRQQIEMKQEPHLVEEYLGNKEIILIVDDIEEQRQIAKTILKRLNYNVVSVSSGEKAVEYLKNDSCDIILLDMIMDPGIDGLETYQKIKNLKPDQKVVIASGFSENERVKEAQRLGAGQYIRKPYSVEKIAITVKKELEKH